MEKESLVVCVKILPIILLSHLPRTRISNPRTTQCLTVFVFLHTRQRRLLDNNKNDKNCHSNSMGVADNLRNLDSHSSVSKEFRVYTIHGAILSVFTICGTLHRHYDVSLGDACPVFVALGVNCDMGSYW